MDPEENYLTSNFIKIDRYIETNIEKKINQLFDVLPQSQDVKIPKMIYDYTVYELYQETIQNIINIINDFTELYSQRSYMDSKMYKKKLLDIFLAPGRRISVGIFLVVLSFILYFIDGSDA
jgi:hypothetical protein